jgi:hypothetical protein
VLYLHNQVAEAFLPLLVQAVEQAAQLSPEAEGNVLPVEGAALELARMVDSAVGEGASVVLGGMPVERGEGVPPSF